MSFHTFLSSEPHSSETHSSEPHSSETQLLSDEKMEMLIEKIFKGMRILLEKTNETLSDRSKFVRFTEKFFNRLGYLAFQEEYDAMPEYVPRAEYVEGGRNEKTLNSEKYNTELSLEAFEEISEYYNIKWKRINERLYRKSGRQTGRQKKLADAFLNTLNGMNGNMIYTQIITNNEFEECHDDDDDDNGGCLNGLCTTMLYDNANKF